MNFYDMHRWNFTICVFVLCVFGFMSAFYMCIRICEWFFCETKQKQTCISTKIEKRKLNTKTTKKIIDMNMHVNKISIICCWFFGEHGQFFFYFSFVVFDLNSDIFFFAVSMLIRIGLFDRFTDYLIKNSVWLTAVIGNSSRMVFFPLLIV